MIADPTGKGGRIRTVTIPMWIKLLMDIWTTAAGHSAGRLLRPVSKKGRVAGEELSDWAVWSVVETSAKVISIERFGTHDLRRYVECEITGAPARNRRSGQLTRSSPVAWAVPKAPENSSSKWARSISINRPW